MLEHPDAFWPEATTLTQASRRAPDAETGHEHRFWLGLLYAGLVCYGAVISTVLGYATFDVPRPKSGWIILIMLAALGLALSIYGLRHRIVTMQCRLQLFACWNIVSFLFVLITCALDGGARSPITYLLILPMLYLAIGYPLKWVLICGITELSGYAGLLALGSGPEQYAGALLQLTCLSIGFLVALVGALTRDRKDRELLTLRQRLETLATTDALTGCLNQRAFSASLSQEVARAARYKHALALLVIDVDHFKHINDRHGHLMGDEVLHQVGRILRQTARHADIVGRPGGDELALLAPETECEAARTLAQRLKRELKSPAVPVEVTVSVGVCALVPDGEHAATIFRRADEALYAAKRRGRDQVASYDEAAEMHPANALSQVS